MVATPGSTHLRRMFDAVDPAAHDGPGQFLPQSVLTAIAQLVPCDSVSFQVMDPHLRCVEAQDSEPLDAVDGNDDEALTLFWQGFWSSPCCSYPNRTGDYTTISRLSDFGSKETLARTSMGPFMALSGVRHEIVMPLPPDGDLDRRMLLARGSGRDFTDDDIIILGLLRPHLFALHLRQRRRTELPELTRRQMQVLSLVAGGCTNVQAARALNVSEGTVRKHLENAYARLEVTNRSAAVAKALPIRAFGQACFTANAIRANTEITTNG